MKRRSRKPQRRGVVLLVILSLLVLFALLGVTFVLVASTYKRGAGSSARAEVYGDDAQRQLHSAFLAAFRDTSDQYNPLQTHSLLNDIYGHELFRGTITSNPSAAQISASPATTTQQFIQFNATLTGNVATPTEAGYFNGCVLTFTSGQQAGVSVRIVGHAFNNGIHTLRVMRPKSDNPNYTLNLAANDQFIINGKPFSGLGVVTRALAEEPNRRGDDVATLLNASSGYLASPLNEDWDAADLQNLFLAAVVPDANHPSGVKHDANGRPMIIPSFHRPALIRSKGGTPSQRTVFRPIPGVNASGNFPAIDWVNGPWDVDNDGDGVADSIWIDLNFPIQTSSSGRRYKPLFAFHIVDMDGRLNLNYHANPWHYQPLQLQNNYYLADGNPTTVLQRKGVGLGPPEVPLGHTTINMGLVGITPLEYRQLFEGANGIPGRSGFDAHLPNNVPGDGSPITAAADLLSATKFFEFPANFYSGQRTSWGSPADLNGNFAVGVDEHGHLITDVPQDTSSDLRLNSVYRTRLATDERFTPHELERILRYYDIDASQLPQRLERLAATAFSGANLRLNRRLVTTDSYDAPVTAASALTPGSPQRNPDPVHLLRRRVGAFVSEQELLSFVDRDFYFGLKMNLNRPLGDGVDNPASPQNQQNGIIDEAMPQEVGDQYQSQGLRLANGADLNNDGTVNATDDLLARHQLAKHLYILATLCVYPSSTTDADIQQQLAQWAVNVVDFRDADSIMTPFEYDPTPFNGWNPDCDGILNPGEALSQERGLVWGCERPELLLTESLALHDRRTSDTDEEDPVEPDPDKPAGKTTDEGQKKDDDYDQKFLPEGSCFIEIYNPWKGQMQHPPAEFYNAVNGGVVLNAVTPGADPSPVWRLLIVKDGGKTRDPDEPGIDTDDKERSVYFTDPSGVNDDHGTAYYADHAIAPLKPGRYAVIGSGPSQPTDNKYTTYLGFLSDVTITVGATAEDLRLDETRQIVLSPDANPDTNQFQVLNNNHSSQVEPNYGGSANPYVQPVVAVVVNRSTSGDERFSLSMPPGGYDLGGNHTEGAAGAGGLIPLMNGGEPKPKDVPLDKEDPVLSKDGVGQFWRVIHLQRLANPLQPHHKETNPYLTIDSIGSDIVCFNGVEGGDEPGADGGQNAGQFETLQRGDPPSPPPFRMLWRQTLQQNLGALGNAEPDDTHHAGYNLLHTLGYLNTSYGDYVPDNNMPRFSAGDAMLIPGGPNPADRNSYVFPWLTFNNRPFNSIYELLDVPAVSSSQLTARYRVADTLTNPYTQDAQNHQFGHLLNYFYDPQTPTPGNIVGLHRIFDYLRVPSKFVEADHLLVANDFVNGTLGENPFHPPYNWVPGYKDPGMVNINTIYSERIWNALLGGDPNTEPGLGPTFAQLCDSRRADGASTGEVLTQSGSVPTNFLGAFRGAGRGRLNIPGEPADDIDFTLLRKGPNNQPLLGNNYTTAYNHSARHPYFRHQTLQRLSNTVTTRSNVYAVWVTVGYFEVEASGLVGQELNADTGEIQRHRAFYMIDRTIPVGFEPGQNHNVERAILVKRFIE